MMEDKEINSGYQIGDIVYLVNVKISSEFKAVYDIKEHTIVAIQKNIKSTSEGDVVLSIHYETSYMYNSIYPTKGSLHDSPTSNQQKRVDSFIHRINSSKDSNAAYYKQRVKYGISDSFHFATKSEVEKMKYRINNSCGLSNEDEYKIKNQINKLESSISNREKLLEKSYTELNNLKKLLNEQHKKSEV